MSPKKYYQWERFWCPASGSYSLDNGGFLVDPKSEWGKYYKDSTALTFDEIPTTPCLVLLGEPGIGKTKALDDVYKSFLSNDQSKSLWFDLRIGAIASLESNQLIKDWINDDFKLSLFLDSLDEGLLNVKTIAGVVLASVVAILINLIDYENNSILKSVRSNQPLLYILIIAFTVIIILLNSRKPISD